jgi:hypothetical protein
LAGITTGPVAAKREQVVEIPAPTSDLRFGAVHLVKSCAQELMGI